MEVSEIRRFELQARNDQHLRERLTTFRHAVHARNGAIIEVRWTPQTMRQGSMASVVYELPVAAGVADHG